MGKRRHRRSYNEPGHAHELTFSCYHRYRFLEADRCCQWLAEAIEEMRLALDVKVWAYVFMPEHVHLLIYPARPKYEMEEIWEAIKEEPARKAIGYLREHAPEWLPRLAEQKRDRVRYHFWQKGGGYDRNIIQPRTLLSSIDYLHMNPYRRALVQRAEDWHWSSACWYLCGREPPIRLDPIPPEWLEIE